MIQERSNACSGVASAKGKMGTQDYTFVNGPTGRSGL